MEEQMTQLLALLASLIPNGFTMEITAVEVVGRSSLAPSLSWNSEPHSAESRKGWEAGLASSSYTRSNPPSAGIWSTPCLFLSAWI